MRYKVILINPYIYDFSAYNLWSYPLGLLKTAQFLSIFDVELHFIDCIEREKYKQYYISKYKYEKVNKPWILRDIKRIYKRYGIREDAFVNKLKSLYPFDIILITSIMTYWYPGVQRTVEIVREHYKDIPIILGGIYSSIYPEHAVKNSGVDAICIGQAEKSLTFLLNTFGFRLKKKSDNFISFYKLGYPDLQYYAPIQTSSGCPFRCSYCASHLLTNQFIQRPIQEVINDIHWFCHMGFTDLAFYDDALLYNSDRHIKVILRSIIEKGLKLNLHCPNGIHARFIDKEVADLMYLAGFKTIRIGFETINKARQIETGAKANEQDLINAIANLKSVGFTKNEIGVYLMYGMPNQDIYEVYEGIKFLKDLNVKINLTEYSPIKGTPLWTELVKKRIIDDTLDPLLTNNTIFAELFWGYSVDTIQKMKQDVKDYNLQ